MEESGDASLEDVTWEDRDRQDGKEGQGHCSSRRQHRQRNQLFSEGVRWEGGTRLQEAPSGSLSQGVVGQENIQRSEAELLEGPGACGSRQRAALRHSCPFPADGLASVGSLFLMAGAYFYMETESLTFAVLYCGPSELSTMEMTRRRPSAVLRASLSFLGCTGQALPTASESPTRMSLCVHASDSTGTFTCCLYIQGVPQTWVHTLNAY